MSATSIEWTDVTWNPVRGCSRVSPGCDHCYAIREARRMDHTGGSYEGLTRALRPNHFNSSPAGKMKSGSVRRRSGADSLRKQYAPSRSDQASSGRFTFPAGELGLPVLTPVPAMTPQGITFGATPNRRALARLPAPGAVLFSRRCE